MRSSYIYPGICVNIGCSLYSQSAEEVDFSGNAITAVGIEAFDGILQINTALKSLNLSGNDIGDEGAKVFSTLSSLHSVLFCSLSELME